MWNADVVDFVKREKLEQFPEHIDDLIAKVLADEADTNDRHTLGAWLTESEVHQQYLKQMSALYIKSEQLSTALTFDTDAAWEKVSKSMGVKEETPVIQLKPKTNYFLRIAAVVVLALGVGFFIWNNQESAPQYASQSINEVLYDTLPDGTLASLNKQSKLTYEFDKKKNVRKAKLEGEAYFVISEDKANQFLVQAEDLLIKDIGTAFNVKALATSDTVEVFVKEGEVQIYTEQNVGLNLRPGETGYYIKSSKKFYKSVEEVEDLNAAAYADREFKFRNASMRKVLKEINKVYDIKLELSNKEIESCQITVNFRKDDIETIASVIAETMGWTVRSSENKLTLVGSSCQ